MSWIALVGPEIEENLGIRHLAAALGEAGFDTAILPYNEPWQIAEVRSRILEAPKPPSIVALSLSFQWRALDMLGLALGLREAGYAGHITAGGHFGHFCRRELLEDFAELDSICRYEAEGVIVDLARALLDQAPLDGVPGLTIRAQGRRTPDMAVKDGPARERPRLQALPWPDRRGEPALCLGHPMAAMISGRGCYASCSFCCIAAWHAQGGGPRFRLRPPEDVAAELGHVYRTYGAEIFIFHDDNFFLPGARQSLERIHALGDALEAEGIGRIATVVKARPTDVTPEVIRTMQERLGLIRLFLGVESGAHQGLRTLGREITEDENERALALLESFGLYTCFNLLVFDPDTTVESLETNLAFMERFGHHPLNFGRVELYAGTPLLERMQAEGRCRGDYLGWDYTMVSPRVQRVFELAMACFHPRNFASGALANRLQSTRFDVAVAAHFHPEVYSSEWLDRSQDLHRRLAMGTVSALREILDHTGFVTGPGTQATRDAALVETLSGRLRTEEAEILGEAERLEGDITRAVGARCRHARPTPSSLEIVPCRRSVPG